MIAYLWWLPMVIVIGWGGLAFYFEWREWHSRRRWTLPSDRLVIRPPAYRDMRE